jgi:hypothetical protein
MRPRLPKRRRKDRDGGSTPVVAKGSPAPKGRGAKRGEPLRYGWQVGKRYSYEFSVEGKIGSEGKYAAKGGINYTPEEIRQPQFVELEQEEGTGSAFLVSREGHLVTCAHVVKGATKIDVELNDVTSKAEVVALDNEHDLALLKMEAGDWTTLPIGDSRAVQLAQDVRVAGYPLTDVLGRSIKITRGTIAGIVERSEEGELFQVDAAVNAGNSGGPLVNESGHVVGVASAKLCGAEISNIGFAVPAERVQELLSDHGVAFRSVEPEADLPGPELAKRVTPAVALLNVTIGPGGVGLEPQVILAYESHMRIGSQGMGGTGSSASGRIGPFGRPGFGPPIPRGPFARGSSSGGPSQKSDRGKLTVDVAGEVLGGEMNVNLPFLLGPQALLVIDPLGDGATTWRRQRAISVITKETEESGSPFGPGLHRPPPFGPFGPRSYQPQEKITSILPAFERYDYELGESKDDTIVIHRRYELKTLKQYQAKLELEVEGEAKIVFNTKDGVPESMTYECRFTVTQDQITLRIPVNMTYGRVADDAVAKSRGATVNPSDPVEPPKSLSDHEIDDLLEQFTDRDRGVRWRALDKLKAAKPDKRREEVAAALAKAMFHEDPFTRQRAAGALRVWHVEANVPDLIKALDDKSAQGAAVAVLGEYPQPRCAEALVKIYKWGMTNAKSSLIKMGPAAEEPVLESLLNHEEWTVRGDACAILAEIGTEKSLPALKKFYDERKHPDRQNANKAIEAIKARIRAAEAEAEP